MHLFAEGLLLKVKINSRLRTIQQNIFIYFLFIDLKNQNKLQQTFKLKDLAFFVNIKQRFNNN